MVCTSWAATLLDADSLIQHLFTSYNTELRPVQDQGQSVNVSIGMTLISINSFDEIAGVISVSGGLHLSWTDETLTWDPNSYGNLTYITTSLNKIWHPNLFSADPLAKAFYVGHDQFKVKIMSHGQVSWINGGLLRGRCIPDVSEFPFDTQTCKLEFFPIGYTPSEISFTMVSSAVDLGYFRQNSEFILTGSKTNVQSYVGDVAEFYLIIQRRPLNFLVSVIFPIVMLALINPLVFVLPFTSGERSSYSITVLLAFTVYMTVVSDKMPESSDPISYLSYYILTLLAISTLIVAVNVLQIQIQANEEKRPLPQWICNLILVLREVDRRVKGNDLDDP
ncbi:acetylcholine receptor subunit delta-like [Pecten maximus]|uniref:acetylcholine receptor subunit delta-like n=1 Tax=Pecten maximus TaxID=6579 RepID=UPI001457E8EA|nr:acetylcholine receptor subunit delta-like [Pecten maximus]